MSAMTTAATTSTNGAAPITGGGPTHAEAPASATVRATHTATGYEWILTLRTTTAAELLSRVTFLGEWLTSHQWTPAASRPAAPSTTATADAPTCPTHGCAMKQGRRGWYCPTKILDDDGTGRPVYCKATR